MTSTANLIRVALQEDLPDGDVTTDSLQLEQLGLARVVAKEDLVLSGTQVFTEVFQTLDSGVTVDWQFSDGSFALKGQVVCIIRGRISSILKGERVALNFLGMLSGVATLTRCYVEEIKHTKTKILDTRKTAPGLRELQKNAVRHGGGENHRLNLSTAVLIKENHVRLAGGITAAVRAIRKHNQLPIEVETRNLDEVREAANLGVWRILLDNMSNEVMREALKIIPATTKTEASGNMNLERVRGVAEIGVDYISVGALTHSAPCADLSLLLGDE